MFYSLVFLLLEGESSPRTVLCRGDNDRVITLELMQRFGFNRAKVSAVLPLSDMPQVSDPNMEALYEVLKKDMKVPGSVADFASTVFGDAVLFGYMMAQRNLGQGGGPSDPSDDDAPDSPDGNPTGGIQ